MEESAPNAAANINPSVAYRRANPMFLAPIDCETKQPVDAANPVPTSMVAKMHWSATPTAACAAALCQPARAMSTAPIRQNTKDVATSGRARRNAEVTLISIGSKNKTGATDSLFTEISSVHTSVEVQKMVPDGKIWYND